MTDEVWCPISGDKRYEVSNLGNFRLIHDGCVAEGVRKTGGNGHYEYVKIPAVSGVFAHAVHRIVAWAFIGPPPRDGYHVHHIDGDKSNNRADNLVYMSPSEHMSLTAKSIRRTSAVGEEVSERASTVRAVNSLQVIDEVAWIRNLSDRYSTVRDMITVKREKLSEIDELEAEIKRTKASLRRMQKKLSELKAK